MATEVVLDVRDAVVEFNVSSGVVRALDGVSLQVKAGETVAVVGESGCGKTTLARAVLGLQPLAKGEIILQGEPVVGTTTGLAERVGMVWQDPFASLDPKWKLIRSIREPSTMTGKSLDLSSLISRTGLENDLVERYPHQVSGGQRQRAAIARALAMHPPLVICDEPTAALDMSIQAQILNLLKELQASEQSSFLYISHDLLTVRFLAHRVAVMYLGRIVEEGLTEEIFESPRHPYTKALLESVPSLDTLGEIAAPLSGELPDPTVRFVGCRFEGRCIKAEAKCKTSDPPMTQETQHSYACWSPNL